MRTVTDLDDLEWGMLRAIAKNLPVTLDYTKADRSHTLRTVEPYEIIKSRGGHRLLMALDRDSREPRAWRLDRIARYTLHRGGRGYLADEYEESKGTAG